MLYAMLAGRLPWDAAEDPEARLSPRPLGEVLGEVLGETLAADGSGAAAAIPAELDIEIRRALSTRAQNRPPHAAAVLEAVRQAAGMPPTGAPAPSETARLPASGGHPAQPPPTIGPRPPWFAERKPLAWAPTEAAVPAAPARTRRRWPYAIAVGAIALAGAGVAARQLGGGDADSRDAGRRDAPAGIAAALGSGEAPAPWAAGGGAVLDRAKGPPEDRPREQDTSAHDHAIRNKIPLAPGAVPVAQARAELAAAIQHVPADTQVLFGAIVGELRGNEQYDQMLAKGAKYARDCSRPPAWARCSGSPGGCHR